MSSDRLMPVWWRRGGVCRCFNRLVIGGLMTALAALPVAADSSISCLTTGGVSEKAATLLDCVEQAQIDTMLRTLNASNLAARLAEVQKQRDIDQANNVRAHEDAMAQRVLAPPLVAVKPAGEETVKPAAPQAVAPVLVGIYGTQDSGYSADIVVDGQIMTHVQIGEVLPTVGKVTDIDPKSVTVIQGKRRRILTLR